MTSSTLFEAHPLSVEVSGQLSSHKALGGSLETFKGVFMWCSTAHMPVPQQSPESRRLQGNEYIIFCRAHTEQACRYVDS